MKHIFSIHSNICAIAIYDTVRHLVEEKKQVIIVSDRNTKFPFFTSSIKFYDIQYITDKYKKNTSNLFCKLVNYAISYLPQYKISARDIINDEEFILYLSSSNYFTMTPYLRSKKCKGYYYIEEGSMSYMPLNLLKKIYYRQLASRQFLLNIIGSRTRFDYAIDDRYLGCICLSEKAFPWCNDKKIVNTFNGYFFNIQQEEINADYLIITDYLNEDTSKYINAFEKIIDSIMNRVEIKKIAIKFHPTAMSYESQKARIIVDTIKTSYSNITFVILDPSFSIEKLMSQHKVNVYCVFGMSSLLLYSCVMGSTPYYLEHDSNGLVVKKLSNFDEIIRYNNEIALQLSTKI